MMFQFFQAIRVGRKTFTLGIHEVSEAIQKEPHFKFFLKAGSVKVAGADPSKRTLKDLPVLPMAVSGAAERSRINSKAAHVSPETEIGGDQKAEVEEEVKIEEESEDQEASTPRKKRR